jgi:hypothetical protein
MKSAREDWAPYKGRLTAFRSVRDELRRSPELIRYLALEFMGTVISCNCIESKCVGNGVEVHMRQKARPLRDVEVGEGTLKGCTKTSVR